MSTAIALTHPAIDRAAWLAERRKGLGASDAPVVLGLSRFATPLDLYLDKLGLAPAQEETPAMRWGHRLEPVIAAAYEEESGNRVVEQQRFVRSLEAPHLFATVDALDEHDTPLEFKTVGLASARELGEQDTDEVPESWIAQAHQQMFCLGESYRDLVCFVVLVGGQDLRTYLVPWNQRFWDAIKPRLDDFWRRVQQLDPPPATEPSDARALVHLYRGCEGEIVATRHDLDLVEEWERLGTEIRERSDRRDLVKAQILERMGEAAAAALPDGRRLKRTVTTTPERTLTVKASTSVRITVSKGRGV